MKTPVALLLVLVAAVPMFGAVAEVTLPVVGYVDLPNDLVYRTELVASNHRDAPQAVRFELVANGQALAFRTLQLTAH